MTHGTLKRWWHDGNSRVAFSWGHRSFTPICQESPMPETPALPAHFSLPDKALAQRGARGQPGRGGLPAQRTPGRAFTLDSMDPGEKPFSLGETALDQAAMDSLAVDIDALQNLFYVDKRYKLLVVLQGT